jgi:hypothetical protein
VERVKEGEDATVYVAPGAKKEDYEKFEVRTMDCIDCHNRPTHAYDMPEPAIDRAIADGRISPSLPFAKKTGVEVLKKTYASGQDAQVAAGFVAFYREKYPELYAKQKGPIESAAESVRAIYARNIFPDMKVEWGTYANNIGHVDFPGCFRCHDDDHKSESGRVIAQDCTSCHELLAMEENNPKIMSDFGYAQKQ